MGGNVVIPAISIVSSAKLAKLSERLGAAAVVVEGHGAGEHLGTERPLFDILPEVITAFEIPVIAAGEIASVIIGESDLSVYLFAGCLSNCFGAAIALGFGKEYQNIELRIKKTS